MFDPERDEEPGARRFYVRLLVIAGVTLAAGLALAPSLSGFSTGVDGEKSCIAIVDGWHADRPGLSSTEKAADAKFYGSAPPSPEERRALERAGAYLTWRQGPGACVPESRHRLIMSGVALGSLGALVAGVRFERRTRRSLRLEPAVAGA